MNQYDDFNDDIHEDFDGEVPDSLDELIAHTFKVGNLSITIQQGQLAKYIALGVYYDALKIINKLTANKTSCINDAKLNIGTGNYRKVATLADLINGLEEHLDSLQDNNNELYLTMKQLSWID